MKPPSSQLEIEVKFHMDNPAMIRRRLQALGAKAGEKVLETNVRFENQDGTLIKTNRLLRLRQDNTCRLTYKCPPGEKSAECKVYQELEVEVSDFKTMTALLNALGYQGVQIYEKWRQVFTWDEVVICMDTMPYGRFIEIEGDEKRIKAAAKCLELPWNKRILENYLAIFEMLRQDLKLPFSDVTFDNFKQHPVDMTPYLANLEAG